MRPLGKGGAMEQWEYCHLDVGVSGGAGAILVFYKLEGMIRFRLGGKAGWRGFGEKEYSYDKHGYEEASHAFDLLMKGEWSCDEERTRDDLDGTNFRSSIIAELGLNGWELVGSDFDFKRRIQNGVAR